MFLLRLLCICNQRKTRGGLSCLILLQISNTTPQEYMYAYLRYACICLIIPSPNKCWILDQISFRSRVCFYSLHDSSMIRDLVGRLDVNMISKDFESMAGEI